MSSLASQLKAVASVDAARLASRHGQPSSKSYLFPASTASSYDFDALFTIALSGFDELVQLDADMQEFEDELFSQAAKSTDRLMLTEEENAKLDIELTRCLRRLGKWIGIKAGGKCIEWLVRRFRVHEMNVAAVLEAFLPYHASTHFPRILSILVIPTTSPFHALLQPLVKDPQPLTRSALITALGPSSDPSLRALREIMAFIPRAIEDKTVHRTLLTFWTGMTVDLVERQKGAKGGVQENVVRILVESFVVLLEAAGSNEMTLGRDITSAVYPPLILLARATALAEGPVQVLATALFASYSQADSLQVLIAALILLEASSHKLAWGTTIGPAVTSIPDAGAGLVALSNKYGLFNGFVRLIEGAFEPLTQTNAAFVAAILDARGIPAPVAKSITALVLASLKKSGDEKEVAIALLKKLQKGYADVLSAATSRGDLDPAVVTLIHASEGENGGDAFLNSLSSDDSRRAAGVTALYAKIEAGEVATPSDIRSAKDIVLSRLADSSIAVIKALYASPDHLLKLVPGSEALRTIVAALDTTQLSQALVVAHVEFLAGPLTERHPELVKDVYRRALFPNLLFTLETRALTSAIWEALSRSSLGKTGLLEGAAVEAAKVYDITVGVPDAVKTVGIIEETNSMIAQILAQNIIAAESNAALTQFLVDQLHTTAAKPRLLAHLVVGNALRRLNGSGQVAFAARVIKAIVAQPANGASDDSADFDEPFAAAYLQAIVTKPHEARTARRARASVLACMVGVAMPVNGVSNWLNASLGTSDDQGIAFRSFADSLYVIANGDLVPSAFAAVLLRSLLASLREDALLFLARTWLFAEKTSIKVSALRHAQAFMQAYVSPQTKKSTADFQVILPALLLAVQDPAKAVRQAAVALVKILLNVTGEKAVDIYALDSVYAVRSDIVQILKPADLHHYLQLIAADAIELVLDSKRLASLHSDILGLPHSQKKQASFRRSIISFLLSHFMAWRHLDARLGLLRSLNRVHDTSKLDILPVISALDKTAEPEAEWVAKLPPAPKSAYLTAVFAVYERASAPALIGADSESWNTLLRFVGSKDNSDDSIILRKLALEKLTQGLYAVLPSELQSAVVKAVIIAMPDLPSSVQVETPAVLEKFDLDATSLVDLISTFAEPLEASQLSKAKKTKVDHVLHVEQVEAALGHLSVLFFSRDFNKLQPSVPLLSCLMSLLSHLIDAGHIVPGGVDFVEQTVLSALSAIVTKIDNAAEMQRAHVGVEVIVKLIRGSSNPRTAQQALLLIANLARLIPDSVLHNIMPIFTFMGASDLQRDDAYSFKVVENTMEQIVPIMAQSLKQSASSPLELFQESRTFLRIFTDMAARLPKHRTTPFFAQFARIVGPEEFLPAILILMVDQSCGKVAKAAVDDVDRLLELPLALIKAFPVGTRLGCIDQVVEEVERLCNGLDAEEPQAFLDVTVESEARKQLAYKSTTFAQVQALLRFAKSSLAALSGKACPQGPAELIVARVLRLTSNISSSLAGLAAEAAQTSEEVLEASLQLLSVQTFFNVVLQQLKEGEEAIVATCLDALIARLPLVREDMRLSGSPAIVSIVKETTSILGKLDINAEAAVDVLGVIAAADVKAEDAALTQVIPVLLEVNSKAPPSEVQISSYDLLAVLLKRVGPRVIPFVKSITEHAVGVLSKSPRAAISSKVFAMLSVMVSSVPTFIAAQQLQDLAQLSLKSRDVDGSDAHALVSAIAKRVPTKTLLPVIFDVWKKAKAGKERSMVLFFELLRLAIRNSDKTALPTLIKPLFAFYLEVFDLRHALQLRSLEMKVVEEVETSAITSFLELVVRLNEATFKPLFVRLYDWAAVDLATENADADVGRLNERKAVLFRVMTGLLTKFKHLLSPYIGVLLPQIDELLQAYKSGSASDAGLWDLLIAMLGKSFEVDDSAYWNEAGLLKLLPKLVSQIPVAERLSSGNVATDEHCAILYSAFGSLAASTTSEPVLKKLNNGILMATRYEEARVRMVALCALDAIWEKQSDELLAFVPETVSEFLAELLEDENAEVEGLARKVLARIEDLTGSLKEYLE